MQLKNITITINNMPVVRDISLVINAGSVHVLMGPNGSGKSSLAYALAGHPHYLIQTGEFLFNDFDLTKAAADERARAGIFLACQQPVVLPGVSVLTFLTESYRAITKKTVSIELMRDWTLNALAAVGMNDSFMHRSVNEGFSGGEKKRFEIVQALILKPSFLILDEIDSGLDIDACARVGAVLQTMRKENPALRLLIITHYPRLLHFIEPDFVHIVHKGRIIQSGAAALSQEIEMHGYEHIEKSMNDDSTI